ncbi:cytochrome P450 [Lanmaoa asiatica]|nr:cytochrome P450 [Lanmaoa asiatica]
MEPPPGIVFIILNSPRTVLPPALAFCGIKLWGTLFNLHVPIWLQVPLYVASFPLALACSVVYADFWDRRQAAINGAILAPQVPSKLPGGLDLLLSSIQNFRSGYMGEVLKKQCKDYGNTITLRILWENRASPSLIGAKMLIAHEKVHSGPIFYDSALSLLGTGVFNSDGKNAFIFSSLFYSMLIDVLFHRSMTRPFFTRDRISDFEIFEKHADDAIGQLKARLRQGYPADFQDMISRFTLDSATEFLFGKDVCSLSAGLVYPPDSPLATNVAFQNHPANQFAHAFLEAQSATSYRGRFGKPWRLFEFWSDRVKKHMHVCHEFIDPILEEALSKKKGLKKAGLIPEKNESEREVLEGETLLDHLVNYTEGECFADVYAFIFIDSSDLTVIRDEILNIMIAGRDTTAGTLTFVVWMLSQHPNVLHKLREEILTVVGNSRSPTTKDLREMKYLKAVINGTSFQILMSTAPVVLPAAKGGQPIYVPANTRVPYSVFLMHRRKDLWGPDAEEFDPDRFLDERLHRHLTPNPFIFVPFNAGPRICLGQQFAYNEVSYFLIRLFQVFSSVFLAEDVQTLAPANWGSPPGRKDVEKAIIRGHLTMYVHDGLWVRMDETSYEGV